MNKLPNPLHYDPKNAKWDYDPDVLQLANHADSWAKQHDIKKAATDKANIHLLLIDMQKDFCFPEGNLFAAGRSGNGATEDTCKIAEFIYANLQVLTNITATLDTHIQYQIFFPWFWVDQNNEILKPHTIVSADEVRTGKYKPNPAVAKFLSDGNYGWLQKQCQFYCEELESNGKYQLYLWPPHALLGSVGHTLAGLIHEARLFHGFTRGQQQWVRTKGGNPLTENYSVFSAEVLKRFDGGSLAQRDTDVIKLLNEVDMLVLAGEAGSHCVKSSIDDLLAEILVQDPKLAQKVYILEDCMSAVVIPNVADFTSDMERALNNYKNAGMHVVKSTDPIESWPDVKLPALTN